MIIDEIAFRSLLSKGENIQYVAHRHLFSVYGLLFKTLFFGIGAPLVLFYLFPPFSTIWLVWLSLGILLFIYHLAGWYLDAWIITNFAVIDQEWTSLFNKASTRIEYQSIEGVTTDTRGFWATVLGFGNIQIQHQNSAPIVLEGVSRPRRVERMIIFHQQQHLRQQNFEDHSKLKDLLTNLLRNN